MQKKKTEIKGDITDQTENIYIDSCSFIRTSWQGTGTKFFPKYG